MALLSGCLSHDPPEPAEPASAEPASAEPESAEPVTARAPRPPARLRERADPPPDVSAARGAIDPPAMLDAPSPTTAFEPDSVALERRRKARALVLEDAFYDGEGEVAAAPARAARLGTGGAAHAPMPAPKRPLARVRRRPPAPVRPRQSRALQGGEIDDTARYEAFLKFAGAAVERFGQHPGTHWVDVSRRHLITVHDSRGRSVPDAEVVVVDQGGAEVARLRTGSDGRAGFFPRAYGSDGARYRAEASRGQLRGQVIFGDETAPRIALDGPRPVTDRLAVDVAFVVDATGSMREEIRRIQDTVVDIAARLAAADQRPALRLGLVAYRDRGDDFVTRIIDFTPDVAAFQRSIRGLEAAGGGDNPESLNPALRDALQGLQWRGQDALRLTFVIADAPAHHYPDESYVYSDAMKQAATMGIKLFPISSGGSNSQAELQFRQMAQFTLGHFVFITEGGGSPRGSGGSRYNVDPADFRVEQLDNLIVRLVTDEMQRWTD